MSFSISPYSANETKMAESEQELFAELPIGAARLGGKVGGGRALRTDYMLVGVKRLPVMRVYSPDKLRGDCAGATHVVSKLYVGGFAMATGESERIGAGASVFGVGAGADSSRSAERLVQEGMAEACAKAQQEAAEMPRCSVPLRIGLTPIEGRVDGSCPAGASWDGEQCVQKKVASAPKPSPPAPSPAPAARTPRSASRSCPSGMAFIPGGSFMMGSNDGQDDEKPVHRATVDGFCMDVTEATVADYRRCVDAGACSTSHLGEYGKAGSYKPAKYCNWKKEGRDEHPINCIDWHQAKAYCG